MKSKKTWFLLILGFLLVVAVFIGIFVFFVRKTGYDNKALLNRPHIFIPQNKDLSIGSALEAKNEPMKMLFFGDLMLDRNVGDKINKYGLDYLLGKLNENNFTSGYDLVSANLEGAVSNAGEHYLPQNAYDFAFAPELISQLKKYNFNFFNLSNNHLSDQGKKGIDETYKNLSNLGFYYSGCSDATLSPSSDFSELASGEIMPVLLENNCSEIILNIKNKKIALLGFSQVYKNIDKNKILEKIGQLKEKSDLLIVNAHFGLEYQEKANENQVNLAREMVDSGADIIIGHHPHVTQNYEIYQQKPIFYSLGNFIFDQYFSPETQEGLAVSLTIDESNQIQSEVYKIKTKGSQIVEIVKMP